MSYEADLTHEERRARRDRIIQAIRDGETAQHLAAEWDLGVPYVQEIARDAGIPFRRGKPKRRQQATTRAMLEALLAAGHSVREVCRLTGYSRQWVSEVGRQAREAQSS